MARLIALKIDVTKIRKERLYKGAKGTYLDLTVALNDEKDEYQNDVACWEEQSKEEREAKEKKNYLGNGRTVWTDEVLTDEVEQAGVVESDVPF